MNGTFPAYGGVTGMYNVHKFMKLDEYEIGYFIEQVGLAALSLGVDIAQVEYVGKALTSLFDVKCQPPVGIVVSTPELQSICKYVTYPLLSHRTY
jgi:hypothetical protein